MLSEGDAAKLILAIATLLRESLWLAESFSLLPPSFVLCTTDHQIEVQSRSPRTDRPLKTQRKRRKSLCREERRAILFKIAAVAAVFGIRNVGNARNGDISLKLHVIFGIINVPVSGYLREATHESSPDPFSDSAVQSDLVR